MQVTLAVLVLSTLAALAWAALLLRRHGLAGLLYHVAARVHALADAIAVGQERHRLSVAEYTRQAKTAARAIQESL